MPPRRPLFALAPASAGVLAVVAAASIGTGGLLLPAGDPSPGAAAGLRAGGALVGAFALAALVRRPDVGWRRAPSLLGLAAVATAAAALLTLPVSDVDLGWPGAGGPAALPPTPDPPAASPGPSPPVLLLPGEAGLELRGGDVWLEQPDGTAEQLGQLDGGEGALALPPGSTATIEPGPGGGFSVLDEQGGVLAEVPPGGPGLDLGDVRVETGDGRGLLDVDGGTATDPGQVPGGVQVLPDPAAPNDADRDRLGGLAGALLLAALYWMVFVRTSPRWVPRAAVPRPDADTEGAEHAADPNAAEAGLRATLDAMLADPDPRTAIVGAYARLLTDLDAAGLGRQPPEAPHEHLHRVLAPLGVQPTPVHDLADLFVLARFGEQPLTAAHREAAIAVLRLALDELHAAAAPRLATAGDRA